MIGPLAYSFFSAHQFLRAKGIQSQASTQVRYQLILDVRNLEFKIRLDHVLFDDLDWWRVKELVLEIEINGRTTQAYIVEEIKPDSITRPPMVLAGIETYFWI